MPDHSSPAEFTTAERQAIAYALDFFAAMSNVSERRAALNIAPFSEDGSSAPWTRLADRLREG